jgi:hypothetical protein
MYQRLSVEDVLKDSALRQQALRKEVALYYDRPGVGKQVFGIKRLPNQRYRLRLEDGSRHEVGRAIQLVIVPTPTYDKAWEDVG